jgi:lipopolysaccharide/colanic/teichoic acid biosynthesis glycosyltransferase
MSTVTRRVWSTGPAQSIAIGAPFALRRARRECLSFRLAKRALDITGALAGLCVLATLWPFIALAIVLDSPGPMLFRQARPGLGKRPFWLYKFRTMYRDAERRLPQLLADSTHRNPILIDIPNDPRVTRVGRLLRRTSLDELPQFINILQGNMSLVGPRPFSRALYSDHPLLRARFLVKPGLTGLWQVNGRKNTSFDEALALDLRYVRNCCAWEDLRILFLTFPAILGKRGAR